MELMLRCEVPNRPGALAALAGAIGERGGDIQAVDVVGPGGEAALDDLLVVIEPGRVEQMLAGIEALEGVTVVHAGPSRGHPGDAVTRVAVGLESLLNGAMTLEHGLRALLGGLLRAGEASLVAAEDAPAPGNRRLVLEVDDQRLVLTRDYPFTPTERDRAGAILRAALEASRARLP